MQYWYISYVWTGKGVNGWLPGDCVFKGSLAEWIRQHRYLEDEEYILTYPLPLTETEYIELDGVVG